MDERTALLGLRLVPGIGSGRLHELLRLYGSGLAAWRDRAGWSVHKGFGPALCRAAAAVDESHIRREYARLHEMGARMLIEGDDDYPRGLRDLRSGSSPVLFVKGKLPLDVSMSVAIVGTRRPSAGGSRLAREMASQLAAVGCTVVSGMALGIDGAAHRGALQVGGKTVAVLGCGLDYVYPPQHASLMEEIAATGAVVTEYPLGTEPFPRHFPKRNRIIAGLSAGVVVVESGTTGGALHTVDFAASAGREVMAVPGDVFRWQSGATNQLIKDGASLVRNAADVLHVLGRTSLPSEAAAAVAPDDASDPAKGHREMGEAIIEHLRGAGALTADQLAVEMAAPVATIAATLTWMEVIGRVVRGPGGRFSPSA